MLYLDYDRLEALDPAAYQARKPYPWANPERLLCQEGYERLLADLPDVSRFEKRFGEKRSHGQQSHDRYALEYRDDLALPDSWREFIGELKGPRYRELLCRLVGRRSLVLNFHWHYASSGCAVSPHCDAKRKLGSHIFYFNTEKDWDPAWGGETVILDDRGRFSRRSAPDFDDFDVEIAAEALGNRSLIFTRNGNSWHGVRPVRCPSGRLRRVFIVVLNGDTWTDRVRSVFAPRKFARY